ncbi:hypothetical protein RFI_13534 [Reticulomyxa filosa]|uniref:Uncharacterized protein n=1 Tax=Reticulomyxa filosa TaxID=46433 RepID=X6NCZ5_RETFI|nr:hypothetical protein RFI_13534 [Reticulomyxa filosa]|eukprot:ETO23644.1 hypothetical protein RFI_13534 [Reticulomyxa filosa]
MEKWSVDQTAGTFFLKIHSLTFSHYLKPKKKKDWAKSWVAEIHKDIVVAAFKNNQLDGKKFTSFVLCVDDLSSLGIPKIAAAQIFNAYYTIRSKQIMSSPNKNYYYAKKVMIHLHGHSGFQVGGLHFASGGRPLIENDVFLFITLRRHNFFADDVLVHNKGLMGPDIRSRQIVKTTDKSPFKYYKVFPGLNYEGTCKNRSCDAYGQKVITERGFGDKIYPLYEEIEEKINCPGCKQSYEVDCYNLFECRATITYTLEKSKTKRTDQLEATEDNIVVLGEGKKKIEYGFLALTVTEL